MPAYSTAERETFQYAQGFGGISRAVRPHLLPPDKWYDALNMRFTRSAAQMRELKSELIRLDDSYLYPVNALVPIPQGYLDRTTMLVLTAAEAYRYGENTLVSTVLNGATTRLPGDSTFVVPASDPIPRWKYCSQGRRVWFSNPYNKIHHFDGSKVTKIGNAPAARYVDIFYDHLIAADVCYNSMCSPQRVRWSDLYDVDEWDPQRKNEADYYDCDDKGAEPADYYGVCGIGKMADFEIIYTPTCVFRMTYVGLPRVFRTDPIIYDVGCDFPYGLAVMDKMHFFVSRLYRNFYMYNGQQPVQIGNDIADYFFDDLNTSMEAKLRTYTYVDESKNEIAWVYVSKNALNTNTYDKAVVYNWREQTWYPFSMEDVHCFSEAGALSMSADELVNIDGAIESLAEESIDGMGYSRADNSKRYWGSSCGRILIDQPSPGTDPIQQPLPYLESKDFVYGDMNSVTEVESLIINADVATQFTDTTLDVEIAVRDSVDDPVSFTLLSQKWKKDLVEGRLSFPRKAGKVHRYRFRPTSANVATGPVEQCFSTYVEAKGATDYVLELQGEGRFVLPQTGKYEVEVVGAGGGGGAQGVTDPSLVIDAYPETSTRKFFTGYTVKSISTNPIVRSNLTTYDYEEFNPGEDLSTPQLRPVAILDESPGVTDPNLMSTQAVRDWLYSQSKAKVKTEPSVILAGGTFLQAHTVFWKQLSHPQSYYPAEDYMDGNQVMVATTAGQSIWVPMIAFSYIPSGSYDHYNRAGGGAGAYQLLRLLITNLVTIPEFYYFVGKGTDHTVTNDAQGLGWHTLGGNGQRSRVWYPGEFDIICNGGQGGGYSVGPLVNGTGGVFSLSDPNEWVDQTLFQLNGGAATAASLPSQVALGGAGWADRNAKSVNGKHPDGTGIPYGGGGCGIRPAFVTSLPSTKGADGRVVIRYRIANT